MDIRIVNTCNNNCLYCLEQSYRNKEDFISTKKITGLIELNKGDRIITFYWWNSLLHPDLLKIINFSKTNGFDSIWLLTNTYWLNKEFLSNLIKNWLSSIWFYFNNFDDKNHNLIVNWGIELKELLKNILMISSSSLSYKCIIHINKINIKSLYKDILILNKKYLVDTFEFINYFPFDRPYDKYREELEYDYNIERININKLFRIIKKLDLNVNFLKFDKQFFWDFMEFYDYKKWILEQIWKEDILRLKDKIPFCFQEKRCKSCFIKDNCEFYERKI